MATILRRSSREVCDNLQSSSKSQFFKILRQNCLLLEPGTKFGSNLMTRADNASFSEKKFGPEVTISDSGNQLTNLTIHISLQIHNGQPSFQEKFQT